MIMNENQNTEWKESWRDEYLKWICGFANATGGKIYIGMNDNGKVVGVADADKLLEDIPNKVRDVLGIIVDVNLLEENGLKYIEIDVPPYSNPINYKGQYHYRSGSMSSGLRMHDLCAIAWLARPELFTLQPCFVAVETQGTWTAGTTVVDIEGRLGQPANAQVALDIDVEGFQRWAAEVIALAP